MRDGRKGYLIGIKFNEEDDNEEEENTENLQ